MTYYGGFLWSEIQTMPVAYKRWFIERIGKEIKGARGDDSAQTRALHQNSPEVRYLQGKNREQSPSRLRRFT